MNWFIKNITEIRMRCIAALSSIIIIIFPPFEVNMIQNGVELNLQSGHHFIFTDNALVGGISSIRVILYITLIWMVYILASLFRKYIKEQHSDKFI